MRRCSSLSFNRKLHEVWLITTNWQILCVRFWPSSDRINTLSSLVTIDKKLTNEVHEGNWKGWGFSSLNSLSVLTFSFLPLYGFFTNSVASTMSSVIVLYLRTWNTNIRRRLVINTLFSDSCFLFYRSDRCFINIITATLKMKSNKLPLVLKKFFVYLLIWKSDL